MRNDVYCEIMRALHSSTIHKCAKSYHIVQITWTVYPPQQNTHRKNDYGPSKTHSKTMDGIAQTRLSKTTSKNAGRNT